MKVIFAFALVGSFTIIAHANKMPGRSLPTGETPKAITAAYSSPEGELHFLEEKGSPAGILLRRTNGALFSLARFEGPESCQKYKLGQDIRCRFFFTDGSDGVEVSSQDLKELNLFESVSIGIQSRASHVSL